MCYLFKFIAFSSVCLCLELGSISAAPASPDFLEEIDAIANEAIEMFHVPGAAVAIVVDDQVIFSRGYGYRNLSKKLPVTESTLFPIASCTKAFTALVLCQLVEEGKITLDDPVKMHLPEFNLLDQEMAEQLTIRDLLAHRTGMARHDTIWICSEVPRSEIIDLLQKIEPVYGLRQVFQYNNFMYALAGIVIERVTGLSWEEVVSSRLLMPLEMKSSNVSFEQLQAGSDFSLPYAEIDGIHQQIPFRPMIGLNPAGGINSNIIDMAHWVGLQFSDQRVIRDETLQEMHTIQILYPASVNEKEEVPELGYGLGWRIGKFRGHDLIGHGGDLDGFSSEVSFLPKEKIGLVILTNSSSDGRYAIISIRNQIFDKLLGLEGIDWVDQMIENRNRKKDALREVMQSCQEDIAAPSLESYVGCFEHPAYGVMELKMEEGHLIARYGSSVTLLHFKSEGIFRGILRELVPFGVNPVVDFTFFKNASGDIYKIEVPFEGFRSSKPITFVPSSIQSNRSK